jgi:hypothetical protein
MWPRGTAGEIRREREQRSLLAAMVPFGSEQAKENKGAATTVHAATARRSEISGTGTLRYLSLRTADSEVGDCWWRDRVLFALRVM